LAESAGWGLPHANICWVSERHNILCRDDRGRLHNLAGPACAYPDGWAIYAVHGIRVPADIIEQPMSITIPRIKGEQNAEIRRIMIEQMGLERFVRESAMREVHSDLAGKLYRLDDGTQFVRVVNATPEANGEYKVYFLPVGPSTEIRTAMAGVAETFGMNEETYAAMLPLMRAS
jgi:hypothetical protein